MEIPRGDILQADACPRVEGGRGSLRVRARGLSSQASWKIKRFSPT